MKNVNLTGLFLALVAKYGVSSFKVNSIINNKTNEPVDAIITFYNGNLTTLNLDEAEQIVKANTGEVKQFTVKKHKNNIRVYIEFVWNDDYWNDDWAYKY